MLKNSVITAAALSALVLSACMKNEDTATPPAPAAKYYKDSLPQNVSAGVTGRLGIQIAMEDNKDFMNEAEYLRILSLLDSHQNLIKAVAGDIEKINIGGASTSIRPLANGRYAVHLAFNVSNEQIVRIFSDGFAEYKEFEKKSHLFKTIIPLNVVDTVGLKSQGLDVAAAKLKLVALSIDFSQASGFNTLILGSNGYALNQNGMTIDISDTAEQIIFQLRVGMDTRMTWVREISKLTKDLGITSTLAFQPGIFDGVELAKVIAAVQQKAGLISALNHTFNTVIFGRRFDYDLNSGTTLVKYDASQGEITKWFRDLEKPAAAIDFEAPRAEIQAKLAARGFNARVAIFMPSTAESLRQARAFSSTAADLDLSLLQKLNISVINVGSDATSYTPATNTLNVNISDSALSVNQYLSTYIMRSAFAQANLELNTYISLLASATFVSVDNAVSFANSQSQNDRLAGFVAWFTRSVDANKVNLTKMTTLRLTDSGYETTFSGGILSVDLQTFDPAQMGKILVAPQPPPAPKKTEKEKDKDK